MEPHDTTLVLKQEIDLVDETDDMQDVSLIYCIHPINKRYDTSGNSEIQWVYSLTNGTLIQYLREIYFPSLFSVPTKKGRLNIIVNL